MSDPKVISISYEDCGNGPTHVEYNGQECTIPATHSQQSIEQAALDFAHAVDAAVESASSDNFEAG